MHQPTTPAPGSSIVRDSCHDSSDLRHSTLIYTNTSKYTATSSRLMDKLVATPRSVAKRAPSWERAFQIDMATTIPQTQLQRREWRWPKQHHTPCLIPVELMAMIGSFLGETGLIAAIFIGMGAVPMLVWRDRAIEMQATSYGDSQEALLWSGIMRRCWQKAMMRPLGRLLLVLEPSECSLRFSANYCPRRCVKNWRIASSWAGVSIDPGLSSRIVAMASAGVLPR